MFYKLFQKKKKLLVRAFRGKFRLPILFFCLLSVFTREVVKAQDALSHPVFTPDYISLYKIDRVVILDSLAADASSFNMHMTELDFDPMGLVIKSVTMYDSLPETREMWYYYYNENKDIRRKEARALSDNVSESFEWVYDANKHLTERIHKIYRSNGTDLHTEHKAKYIWEGDSIRIEHDLNRGKFEIVKYDKNGFEIEIIGNHKKIYNENGDLLEIIGTGCDYNKADKESYKIIYKYNQFRKLIAIEENGKYVWSYFYDEKGRIVRQVYAELRTGKIKSIGIFKYDFWH